MRLSLYKVRKSGRIYNCTFLYRRLTHDTQNWNCGFEDDYKNISRNQVIFSIQSSFSSIFPLSAAQFAHFRSISRIFSLIPRDCALYSSNIIIPPNFPLNTILIVAQFLHMLLNSARFPAVFNHFSYLFHPIFFNCTQFCNALQLFMDL